MCTRSHITQTHTHTHTMKVRYNYTYIYQCFSQRIVNSAVHPKQLSKICSQLLVDPTKTHNTLDLDKSISLHTNIIVHVHVCVCTSLHVAWTCVHTQCMYMHCLRKLQQCSTSYGGDNGYCVCACLLSGLTDYVVLALWLVFDGT